MLEIVIVTLFPEYFGATLQASIDGAPVTTPMPTITVTSSAPVVDATKCVITVTPASIAVSALSMA